MSIRQMMIELNQRPVSYYPVYRKLTGRLTAGVLLSQILFHWSYWASHEGRDKFHLTDEQLMEETGLTPDEFRLAKRTLKGLSFLKITREGVPARTYYEVDAEALAAAIRELDSGNPTSQIGEIPQSSSGVYQQTINTETPSETPSEKYTSSAVLQGHVVRHELAASAEQVRGQSESSEPSPSPQEQVEAEIQRRRERSTEQILRRRRAEAHRRVAEAVLAPGTEEARLLWARFVELTRRNGERSFLAWLDEQVRPELERLGPERFRTALAEAVARASSPDVRSPPALIMRVLRDTPAESTGGAPKDPEDFFAWLDRHAGGAT